MRGGITAIAVLGLAAGMFAGPVAAAAARDTQHGVGPGTTTQAGETIDASGPYAAVLRAAGRLVVRNVQTGQQLWATPSAGRHATLAFTERGQLVLRTRHGAVAWRSGTRGSDARRLSLRADGALTLTAAGGLVVWTSRVGSQCPAGGGKSVTVDISEQRARMCRAGQQIRTTPVTTGASALGYGTPTGAWSVYARVRDTTLYPAAGGAYPVHYWMPYSGPYGFHDSPWQHFRYGSAKYTTRGSHGCVHVPGPMMAWLFGWAAVGTSVVIHG